MNATNVRLALNGIVFGFALGCAVEVGSAELGAVVAAARSAAIVELDPGAAEAPRDERVSMERPSRPHGVR